jgi:hypothetical protein
VLVVKNRRIGCSDKGKERERRRETGRERGGGGTVNAIPFVVLGFRSCVGGC